MARRVHVDMRCSGNVHDKAMVTMRWGHPDKDHNEYFVPIRAVPNEEKAEMAFSIADENSELELQTEGGHATGYLVRIWFGPFPSNDPNSDDEPEKPDVTKQATLWLQYKYALPGEPVKTLFNNYGSVGAKRSAGVNEYGEQNIRIILDGDSKGPIP